MGSFFSCYLWWVILGIFIGFLAFWLFDKYFRRDGNGDDNNSKMGFTSSPPVSTQSSVAASTPKPVEAKKEETKAAEPKPVKAKTETPKTAKPKVAKPKQVKKKAASSAKLDKDNASEFGFKPTKKGQDDLTIVEGIGPKISQILISKEFNTFEKLSLAKYDQIKQILDDSGPAYKLAKPDSWPKQAMLAHTKQWKELKVLQDRLIGGVEPDDK